MSNSAQKTVYFHGSLKEILPEPVRMSGRSIREVLNGLVQQFPQLQRRLGSPVYHVTIDGVRNAHDVIAETDMEEIHVRPTMTGAGGGGGLVQIAVGALFIAAAIAMPASITGLSIVAGATVGSVLAGVGISLVLGGLLQLLSPAPDLDVEGNKEGSKYLGAPQNTVKIGTRIPLIFGTHKAYGHFLAFNVDAKDFGSKKSGGSSNLWDDLWLWVSQNAVNEPKTEKSDPPQPPELPPYFIWSGGNP